MESVIYSEEQLREKCAEWQKILRLQDWVVVTGITRERDMNLKNCNANISINLDHRSANIQLIDPVDYDPDELFPQDMEKHLVHELLHIHLFPMTKSYEGIMAMFEEQAINMIADSIITLYRRGGETKDEKNSDLR
ncbi:hypothetical protein KIH86_07615 [Paenibacillus sp. HN-1]|uniref:hypothetical protein n=1 Tax=Paenibacillus TaxID=44249 RepID=UPI001CA84BF5|nr:MULTISPECIES: hypothetical protein [Paenibacillus]MBY9081004.1 hypothetical protein [Paenibacillus sp. CGMCC 1.18879]MBY9084106.1 hypothetical protein [Paenibacillus sinensis]